MDFPRKTLRDGTDLVLNNNELTKIQQDGTIQPDIKLTGILNTYVMHPGEETNGWGTEVHKGELL